MVGSVQTVRHAGPTSMNVNTLYRGGKVAGNKQNSNKNGKRFANALVVRSSQTAEINSTEEAEKLRQENAELRCRLAERLEALEIHQREAFLEAHGSLVVSARSIGEDIPALGPLPAVVEHVEEDSEEIKAPLPAATLISSEADITIDTPHEHEAESVVSQDGVVIEVERDNTLVFKFASSPASTIGNVSRASSLAVGFSTRRPTKTHRGTLFLSNASSKPSSSSSSSSSGPNDGAIVFTFDDTPTSDAKVLPSDSVDASSNSSTLASTSTAKVKTVTATRRRTPAAASTTTTTPSTTTTTPATTTTRSSKSSSVEDPFAAARRTATKEAQSHDASAALEGKEYWLYASVPSTPIAGADCVIYFNAAQSEVLRGRPRIQLHAKYNNWEVGSGRDNDDRVDMKPVESIARREGTDFWSVSVTVPENAYEINFIFSDGEGLFDNNSTQNYVLPVDGPMTQELWIDTAPERAEAIYLAKKEEERIIAEQLKKEREATALKADAETAQNLVDEIKNAFEYWRQGADASSHNASHGATVWRLSSSSSSSSTKAKTATVGATPSSKVVLQYNKRAGPLAPIPIPEDQNLILKIGHNQWKDPIDIIMTRSPSQQNEEEWWDAEVEVPFSAVVMNFVVQYYEHFDNNNSSDYRLLVDGAFSGSGSGVAGEKNKMELWADSLLQPLNKHVTATRKEKEAAEELAEKLKLEARLAVKAKTEHVRRRQMEHVLYLQPAVPEAGKEVTINYNPSNTVLNGAERVFITGGFNRWRHPKQIGPFIEMESPSGAASHFTATIKIPKDAYSIDVVFSDSNDAANGRWDNRGGLDYQFPVDKSVVEEPPLYVSHIAVEMAPICKVGGLGDVVTALGRAVQEQGHHVEVILPRYDFFLQSPLLGATQYETEFDYAGTRIFVSTCIVEGLRCFFLEPANGMFATSTVYQGNSDADRFSFFSKAALEFLLRTGRQPDILHCHDWSTADVAKAYWNDYHSYGLFKPNVVFTIHNLNYGAAAIGEAAYYSQRFTTVSPSYAWEIGGHPAIASNNAKLMGIRNGIDIDIWNPETDQFLPVGYNADSCLEGKAAARAALRSRLGLSGWGDKPLVGVVTRLTKQKGTHLIAHSCFRTLDRGGQFVLLGSAPDPKVQAEFDQLAGRCGGENAAFCFAFDEPLSHLIYAACDLILVPSMFEPCGLTQMIAMRYGAVPVVRATGGLKDTVFDVDTDKERAAWEMEGSTNWVADEVDATNGFAFEGTDEGALDYAMNRALDAYYNDPAWFRNLQERVMRQDWSWNKPAIDYIQLYYAALKK